MQPMIERLHAERKRKRLRRLRLVVYLILACLASKYAWDYVHSPSFAFGTISIHGTSQLSEKELIQMGGGQPPLNLFNTSLGRIREALSHDIRFQNSEVTYNFPSHIQVVVQEREPALYVSNSYRSYFKIDYDGVVLSVTTGIPDAKAPVLVGEKCGNWYTGDKISNENVLKLLCFLKDIDGEARDRITEISIDDRQHIKFNMRDSFPIRIGHVDDLCNKSEVFMTVFKEIKDKNINAEYIDLTFAKPYIKLIPSGSKNTMLNEYWQ